jgi:RNA polymerase sigma factor (sigma-70 family)
MGQGPILSECALPSESIVTSGLVRESLFMKVVVDPAELTADEVAACVSRARQGDEKAVLDLFNYMYPHVAKMVYSNRPHREGVEDLIQQSCIKIVTNLHKYSSRAPFLHWVSRVTINTCLNQMRREKARPEVRMADLSEDEAGLIEAMATAPGVLDSSDQVAAGELVEKLLISLRPPDRLLMRLMYLEGRNVEEISKLTGWSRSVVKVRAFRARGQLRKHYHLLMKETL